MSPLEFENLVRVNLNALASVTPEVVRKTICLLLDLYATDAPRYQNREHFVEQIARAIETKLDLSMPDATVVALPFEEWLGQRRPTVELFYWKRYREFLLQSGFPKLVVGTIDRDTDRIVGLLENPQRSGSWTRRGLVVGHVQSGKTANYNGVICKAADYGFRIIILLAGVHNNLRSQTQQRVEEAFIGVDTDKKDRNLPLKETLTGVGRISGAARMPFSLTSRAYDFRRDSARASSFSLSAVNEPVIFVIKKQETVLRNLIEWLRSLNETRGNKIRTTPMLLIDDEADNASVNTRSQEDPTAINRRIRELLALFEQNCYLGYTATPFANIFIDPESEHEMFEDDLFPRDFIVTLDAPDNYVGAARMFGEDAELSHQIIKVDDHTSAFPERHRITHNVDNLPASLTHAVRRFLLARAVRILRGRGHDHSSMLVNVSRFNTVQQQVAALITDYLGELLNSVQLHAMLPGTEALKDPGVRALHEVWQNMSPAEGERWDDVRRVLAEAIGPVVVRTINNRSPDRLDYQNNGATGLHVIAVGGLSLSRGFTLEGLMVSYFIRNSIMYDTLLQMGRWFGYRDGYLDLCALYMTEDAAGWYSHISVAIDELRAEFRLMERQGRTPRDFGLKVRAHPDALIVTARNKMRSGRTVVHEVSLDGRLIETAHLRAAPDDLQANFRELEAFVRRLGPPPPLSADFPEQPGHLWQKVRAEEVIRFLKAFRNHDDAGALTQTGPVVQFIEEGGAAFHEFDVCLYSLKRGGHVDVGGLPVRPQIRTARVLVLPGDQHRRSDCLQVSGTKMRVASRGAERAGLTGDQVKAAEKSAREAENIGDDAYRRVRTRPLLMLHVLTLELLADSSMPRSLSGSIEKVCAWGLSFPGDKGNGRGARIQYRVNTVWWKEHYGEQSDEDSDEAGE